MNDRIIRFSKALWHETVKRIPYILVVLLVLIFVQVLQNTQVAKKNSTDTKTLLRRVATLSQDNKKLSEQNHELSQQNIQLSNSNSQHIDCLADLFAKYTRNLEPIETVDLKTCIVTQGTSETSATSNQSNALSPSQGPSSGGGSDSAPSSKNNSTSAKSQQDNSQGTASPTSSQATPKPSVVTRVVDFVKALL